MDEGDFVAEEDAGEELSSEKAVQSGFRLQATPQSIKGSLNRSEMV